MINSFRGEHYFLSNFYSSKVTWQGITYLNNESAFQSAKTLDKNIRKEFENLPPNEAKRKGRHIALRKDWDDIKYDIMYEIVYAKFTQNEELKQKLLKTNSEELVEGNNWGDKVWGKVNGIGQNNLGKIIMKVREELKI